MIDVARSKSTGTSKPSSQQKFKLSNPDDVAKKLSPELISGRFGAKKTRAMSEKKQVEQKSSSKVRKGSKALPSNQRIDLVQPESAGATKPGSQSQHKFKLSNPEDV